MSMRKLSFALLSLSLGMNLSADGQESPPIPPLVRGGTGGGPAPLSFPGNETMAQAIARRLRESGQMSRYRVSVTAQNGVVDLMGEVTDESQRQTAINLARSMPGVMLVRDWLQSRPDVGVVTVQGQAPMPMPIPMPQPDLKLPPPRIDGQLPEPQPIFQRRRVRTRRFSSRRCRRTPGRLMRLITTTRASPIRMRIRMNNGRSSGRCIRSQKCRSAGVR